MDTNIDALARILWDFTQVNKKISKADVILVFGSNDIRIAERGVELFREDWAPLILFSSGVGRLTPDEWSMPEAEVFAEVALKAGIPENRIIIEKKATNTGENVKFSKQVLKERNINPKRAIAVHLPFIEKRTIGLFDKHWPEVDVIVSSLNSSYDTYPNDRISREFLINLLVGEVQRLIEYPKKGFILPQDIPKDVLDTYEKLLVLGYNKQLLK
jgi:uncharacterized SAM-binding protein YcdF (DUF218 family)